MDRRTILRAAAFTPPAALAAVASNSAAAAELADPDVSTTDSAFPPTLGVQFHGTWDLYYTTGGGITPREEFYTHLDQLVAHRVKLIRLDVGWSASQPTSAAPTASYWYNKRIDLVLNEAADRGLDVLVTIHQSPTWARPQSGTPRQFPTNPESIRTWTTWMAKTFGDRVMAWEIWNEPNLSEFTGVSDPAERPRRYVPLLKVACEGLRAGDPGATVVFGGPSKTDAEFIRACYELGAKTYFDIMAIHPYQGNQTKPPESTDLASKERMTYFPAVVETMAKYGDHRKPVWWTEFGFSVHSNREIPLSQPWRFGVPDTATAADYYVRSFELARKEYPQVTLAVTYVSFKPPSDPDGHQYGFRIMENSGKALPQLVALRDFTARFPGSRNPL